MPKCGNCGTTLQSNGTCENCDRPRRLVWWEELDLDWEAEQILLDALPAGIVG